MGTIKKKLSKANVKKLNKGLQKMSAEYMFFAKIVALILQLIFQISYCSDSFEKKLSIFSALIIRLVYIRLFENNMILTFLQMFLPIDFSSIVFHLCFLNCLFVPYYQIHKRRNLFPQCKIEQEIFNIIYRVKTFQKTALKHLEKLKSDFNLKFDNE